MDTAIAPAQSRRLHTIKDVQAALRISHATAWRLIGTGALKTVRIGRRRLVTDESLDAVVRSGAPSVGEAA
jgi:hypothetical protein